MNIDAIGNPVIDKASTSSICEIVNCCVVAYNAIGECVGALRCPILDVQPSINLMGWVGYVEVEPDSDEFNNPGKYRVVFDGTAAIVAREPMPTNLTGNILSGVPDGGTVTIEGIQYPTDGTDITLHFGKPGTYVVKCEGFPYTPVEVEVVYGN